MKTEFFDTIQLTEMNQVKLMNRTDRKYWFHTNNLEDVLRSIKDDYFILAIEGKSDLPYATTYYDTLENKMFNDHQNGKLNRFKIRRRSYVDSEISFLEVKFKSNKGRTIKKRIAAEFEAITFTEKENGFLSKTIPFSCTELQPSLFNEFSRLTLVNKNFSERCTIDLNIQFKISDRKVSLDNLVIVEIKSDSNSSESPLAKVLRNQRIKASGFSKYCIGRSVTDPKLKRNAFKQKIRQLEKTMNSEFNLYNIN